MPGYKQERAQPPIVSRLAPSFTSVLSKSAYYWNPKWAKADQDILIWSAFINGF